MNEHVASTVVSASDQRSIDPCHGPKGIQWSASTIAFGLPSDPRTSSGYARHLTLALRDTGHLREEFSAKQLRIADIFRGAIAMGLKDARLRPSVSRRWMWSRRGSELLSKRISQLISKSGDRGTFIQVGTLVALDPDLGVHLMRTDMTIPQARRAGHFAVADLSPQSLKEAEDVQRSVLSQAQHVIAASQWTADSLIGDCGVPPDRVRVIYTGGNLKVPPHLSEDRAEREILFVGLDWQRKGGPLLLEAFRILRAQYPDVTLRIVGCAPQIKDSGVFVEGFLDKRISVQYERLLRCYLRASCFCLPTLFDPFPNVIVEAASLGLPTVAIDNGSRREAVVDGVTGFLVPQPEPAPLAEAIGRLLKDARVCYQFGAAAKQHARANFTWDAAIKRIGEIVRPLQHH